MPHLEYTDEELGLQPGWDNNSDGSKLDPNIRGQLRRSAQFQKEASDARAEAEAAKRDLSLFKAGIPTDRRGEIFVKTYEGDLTDPVALKEAFEGLFGPVAQGENAGDGTEGQQEINNALSGGNAGGETRIDLKDALLAARGDNDKIREILKNAPASAGIKLPDIQ